MKISEFLDIQAVDFSHKNAASIVDVHTGIDIIESEEMQPVMMLTDTVTNKQIKATNPLLASLLVNSKLFTVNSTVYDGDGINKNFRLKDKITIDLRNTETAEQRKKRLSSSPIREVFGELLLDNEIIEQVLYTGITTGSIDVADILTEEGRDIFSDILAKLEAEKAERERLEAHRAAQLALADPLVALGFEYSPEDGLFSTAISEDNAESLINQAKQFFTDDCIVSNVVINRIAGIVLITIAGTVISKS